MAKTFLDPNEQNSISGTSVSVYGAAGNEGISLLASAAQVTADQNLERIDLPLAVSAYQFQQQGNRLRVFAGGNEIVTLAVQGDTDGTVLGFSDGKYSTRLTSGVMSLGGTPVPANQPGTIVPGSPSGTTEFPTGENSGLSDTIADSVINNPDAASGLRNGVDGNILQTRQKEHSGRNSVDGLIFSSQPHHDFQWATSLVDESTEISFSFGNAPPQSTVTGNGMPL